MKILGIILVFVCTFVGLGLTGGFDKAVKLVTNVMLPMLPGEGLIIIGCGVSAFLIANSMDVVKNTIRYMGALTKPAAYTKEDYMELLSALFITYKQARAKGWLSLETHIENPHDSSLFAQFPKFQHNHHAITFFCDYLRIISLGNDNPFEIDNLMDLEIEGIAHHESHPAHAFQTLADGLPALGIVAAVLGVIKTMGSISEPPEILGKMIGGALVGTFLGVWAAYGFAAPIASAMQARADTEVMYFKCIRVGTIAFLNGAAPQVAVEFARKFLPHEVQPSFAELEDALNALPAPS